LSAPAPDVREWEKAGNAPAVAVVMVTYNSARQVPEALRSLAAQLHEGDQVIVVDNASEDGTVAAVRDAMPAARVIEQRHNIGFAGGCNAGVAASSAPLLMLLNPDAVVVPGSLEALRMAAFAHPGWGAWQALVTLPGGEAINTSGGVVHFLGVAWAGLCDEPVARAPKDPTEVGFASGAAMVVRREAWHQAGGFDERYFMYGEDLDLSLRLRLYGYGVGIVPAARVEHEYEFAKNERKWFLLERNRWWTILTAYPLALLLALAPALAAAELALLGVATRGGWLRAKLRANARVLRELPLILRRRRTVQGRRTVSVRAFMDALSADVGSPYLGPLAARPKLVRAQRAYWRAVRALLGLSGDRDARREVA
jgi:N-acetylglucosaminyl-diphospho-decaprenol L-rhamnosyltransferase